MQIGQRLDRFLSEALPDVSRTRIQALIREGHVRMAGAPSGGATIEDVKYRVKQGDCFELIVPPAAEPELKPEAIPLDVVYEDEDVIVIDKAAGLVVHPGAGQPDGTLVNALLAHCGKSLSGIGGVARPGIVHRLDKDTSGLMVAAKNDRAHRALAEQFADHGRTGEMARGYLALVWGAPSRPHGRIEAPIGRHPTSRTRMAVVPKDKGRFAATEWRLVESYGGTGKDAVASLIECTLETGRTHQVRVHLAHYGHPLVGDPLYGAGFKSKLKTLPEDLAGAIAALDRQALHAAHLAFVHPGTGTLLEFNSDLPDDLAEIVRQFKQL
ncbi:RluA family pseudouridine synthase [Methyloceanibacter sp. wino2]|uniref:RluA family pseudouridine synthase n=1 Tax=Methyloceanibacter sp. wino2 TaxID=2170729 RepID=UPI000D3E76F5